MRDLCNLDPFRVPLFGHKGDSRNGAFVIPVAGQTTVLRVIASNGDGWDHLSVSVGGEQRCPTWAEMEFVKNRFIGDVAAMQLHLSEGDHINVHPYTLHIWRPQQRHIPLPPKWMV